MRKNQFRYNRKTLRYERVGFSVWRTLSSFVAYASFGFLFFMALNFVQNYFIETKLEKSLLAENKAMTEYKVVLASQIETSNLSLGELKADESKLYEKLFESPAEHEVTLIEESANKVATNEDWSESMNILNGRFNSIKTKAKRNNQFFSERLSLDKTDVPDLLNLPSTSPVNELTDQNLVSGFGVRINPFHKGNYHHDGIDIALTKGTEVMSTGNGHVVSFSYSLVTLEAGFGNYIEIDHGNGLITRYAHLDKINVTWGQKIKKGQVIGLSGSSGGSVAPHLHYEVIKLGKNVDPITYVIEGISAEKHQQLALKNKTQNQSLD